MTRYELPVELDGHEVPQDFRAGAERVCANVCGELVIRTPSLKWFAFEPGEPRGYTNYDKGLGVREIWACYPRPFEETVVILAHEARHAWQYVQGWAEGYISEQEHEELAARMEADAEEFAKPVRLMVERICREVDRGRVDTSGRQLALGYAIACNAY